MVQGEPAMRAIEEQAPEATHRIDAVMSSWQRDIGTDFEQQLRVRLGAPPPIAEANGSSTNGSSTIGSSTKKVRGNGQSRRSRKRRRR